MEDFETRNVIRIRTQLARCSRMTVRWKKTHPTDILQSQLAVEWNDGLPLVERHR